YQLTLEPHTSFYAQPPAHLPDENQLWDIQTAGQACLAEYGYEHYEISAYTQGQHYCQHNLNYWQFGDYLGIGAGAHSKLTDINAQHIMRFSKQTQPDVYMRTAHTPGVIATQERLLPTTLCLEFMMNALRLTTGFTLEQFSRRTGLASAYLEKPLQQAFEAGWLHRNQNSIQTTILGQRFLDTVLELFVAV
ncbi:MAG: YggW family oxidoreductase, partial [Pseudomonadota bacterium]|nr:YggW family oxidoreductase [Pseudomonadota bacterium]